MSRSTIAVLAIAAVLCVSGVAAATGAASPGNEAGAQADETTSTPTDVDATAVLNNGTVAVTVTAGGNPAENVAVSYDDRTQLTDENGSASFDISEDGEDEVELELEKDGFEGELEYVVEDGTLTLVEEEYEYEYEEDDEREDPEEAEDEEDDEEEEHGEEDEKEEHEEEDDEEDDEDDENDDHGDDE